MTPPLRPVPASRSPASWALAVLLLALVARGTSLENGFVSYDDAEIRAEVAAKGPTGLVTGLTYYAYKPVYGLSLWCDHVLFGDAPFGWHLGNVLLFALAAFLVVLVVHGATRSLLAAVVVGALVAVHPVHTENVAWVAERKDGLSLVLVLLAHLAWRRRRVLAPDAVPVLAPVLLALGGLAKGTVWTYAGVIALEEALARPRLPGAWRRLLPLGVVAVAGIALDAVVGATAGPGAVHHDASLLELAATMATVHARYVLSLVWPEGLSVDYPLSPRGSFADPLAWLGLALAIAAVVGVVVGVRRRRPLLALGCGLWVLGLAPVNNVWPRTSILRADRYLLVPALGAYLLVAAALLALRARAGRRAGLLRGGAVACAVVVAVLAVLSARRAPVFADGPSLWTDTIEKQPGSAIAWINRSRDRALEASYGDRDAEATAALWRDALADADRGLAAARALARPELALRAEVARSLALLTLGRVDEAHAAAVAAVDLAGPGTAPLHADAHAALGRALTERARRATEQRAVSGDLAAAADAFRRAVAMAPNGYDAWYGLGNVLFATAGAGVPEEGILALQRALAIRPDDLFAVVTLVPALYKAGRDAEARAVLERAVRAHGRVRPLRLLEARLRAEAGDPKEAEAAYDRLVRDDPGDATTRDAFVRLLRRIGAEALVRARRERDDAALQEARAKAERALALAPDVDAETLAFAGDVSTALGRHAEARARYVRAAAARPEEAWRRTVAARAGVLEAVAALRDGDRVAAVATAAAVVRSDPPRLDLGFTALDAEIARLKPAAELVARGGAEAGPAGDALLGAFLLVAGDEPGAAVALTSATEVGAAHATSDLTSVAAAARLLRALVRARRGDGAGARTDLEFAGRADPDDPLVAYHRLLLDRLDAHARREVARSSEDELAVAREGAALAAVEEAAAALDARPAPWPGPGLLAAELAIDRADGPAALGVLAGLVARFPEAPSPHRGIAAVYDRQVLTGGSRSALLPQALVELQRARALDPRDPRTSLDLSQHYRLAGDLDAAALHALAAASVEPTPGPASHALAAILVERGRRELRANRPQAAVGMSRAARAYDPASGGPELLDGDVASARDDLETAVLAYRLALEKEPSSADARSSLAACLRRRAFAYFVWRTKFPRPVAKDGVEPEARVLADWDRKNDLARRQSVAELEEALALEPEGEEAEKAREWLEPLRPTDLASRREALALARQFDGEGNALLREGRREAALARYLDAVDAYFDSYPAWWHVAATAFELGPDRDTLALVALDRVRLLDTGGRTPHELLRGRLFARRAAVDPAAVPRARRALERWLAAPGSRGEPDPDDLALARRLLASLPGGG